MYFKYIAEIRYGFLTANSSTMWACVLIMIEMMLAPSAGLFLLFDDILAKRKTFWQSFRRKGLISVLILLLFFSGLFIYPMFLKIPPYPKQSEHAMGVGSGLSSLKVGLEDASYEFNSKNNLWVYQIKAKNSSEKENAEILEIKAQKVPEGSFNFVLKPIELAPPFDNIKVSGGEIIGDRIIIKPLAEGVLVITSSDPLLSIILYEKKGAIQLGFGGEVN